MRVEVSYRSVLSHVLHRVWARISGVLASGINFLLRESLSGVDMRVGRGVVVDRSHSLLEHKLEDREDGVVLGSVLMFDNNSRSKIDSLRKL